MVADARTQGKLWEAARYAVTSDGFPRGQDTELAEYDDLTLTSEGVVFTVGDPAKAESVKTGVDQGVIFDRPFLQNILLHTASDGRSGKKISKHKTPKVRRRFKKRLRRAKLPVQNRPYRVGSSEQRVGSGRESGRCSRRGDGCVGRRSLAFRSTRRSTFGSEIVFVSARPSEQRGAN